MDQFRWPGWANTMAIILYAFIFFITFRKVDSGTNKAVGVRSTSTSSTSTSKNILFLNKVKSALKKVRLRNVLVSSSDHKHKATNALPINDHSCGIIINLIQQEIYGLICTHVLCSPSVSN